MQPLAVVLSTLHVGAKHASRGGEARFTWRRSTLRVAAKHASRDDVPPFSGRVRLRRSTTASAGSQPQGLQIAPPCPGSVA
jgi:hypothetical protein